VRDGDHSPLAIAYFNNAYSFTSTPPSTPSWRGQRQFYSYFFSRMAKIARIDCYLRHVGLSARLSLWSYPPPTGRVFIKFDIRGVF
jgi:hypothetical protein